MNDTHLSSYSIAAKVRIWLVGSIVALLLALGCLAGLYFYTIQSSKAIVEQQLPAVKYQLTQLAYLDRLTSQVQELSTPQASTNLVALHQQLLSLYQASHITMVELEQVKLTDVNDLSRLSQNIQRNQQLTEQALQTITTTQAAIANLPESVTTHFLPINRLLNAIAIELQPLIEKRIPPEIEHLKQLVTMLSADFSQLSSQSPNSQAITRQLQQLIAYFSDEQALLGKWQGSIRLYQPYILALNVANHALLNKKQQLLKQVLPIAEAASPTSKTGIQKAGEKIQLWGYQLSIDILTNTALVLSLVLMMFGVILAVISFQTMRRQLARLMTFIEQQLSQRERQPSPENNEQQHVQTMLNQQLSTVFSQADIEYLTQQNQQQWANLFEHTGCCYWQLDNRKGTDKSTIQLSTDQVSKLFSQEKSANLQAQPIAFWRLILGRDNFKQLIELAKQAKHSQDIATGAFTLADNISLAITISCHQQIWQGTVIEQSAIAELEQQLITNEQQYQQFAEQQLLAAEHDYQMLSEMVVKGMLQSQQVAMVSGTNIQPIHRQLERLFNCVRQQQVMTQIALAQRSKKIVNVNLPQTIYAVINNSSLNAALAQNHIHLMLDNNLCRDTSIDVRLFSQLLNDFCSILLREQFKHQLLLSIKVIDQNAGQQNLLITGKLTAIDQQVSAQAFEVPKHLTALSIDKLAKDKAFINQESANKVPESNVSSDVTISCFEQILAELHAEPVTLTQVEHGLEVSFKLPVTIASLAAVTAATSAVSQQQAQSKSTKLLAQKHILVITENSVQRNILSQYIRDAGAQCETLSNLDHFSKNYNLAAINRQKLDAVILAGPTNTKHQNVRQHIASLPVKKQPVLLIVQSLQNHVVSNVLQIGLYSLSDAPICRELLINELASQLKNKQADNLVVSADQLNCQQFLPAQVELLLAVSDVEQHQLLWRLLLSLGFKVTVVADESSMLKHWQTGRYLILFNEFSQSPYIQLAAGQSISRGVFHFAQDEVIELSESQAEFSKNWHLGQVPESRDIKALTTILAPWLKAPEQFYATKSAAASIENNPQDHQHTSASAVETLVSFEHQINHALPSAFNLQQYMKNQGSPELAAMMMDEYLAELTDKSNALTALVLNKDHQAMKQAIDELQLVAKIIAAPTLRQLTSQLAQAMTKGSAEHIERLIKQVKAEISTVQQYADSI
ncbi:hypothetical protein [Colwellia sp. MEBiC06753]